MRKAIDKKNRQAAGLETTEFRESTMSAANEQLDLDEARIAALLVRERYYRDTSDWQKMRDSYHPDNSKTWVNITWYDTTSRVPQGLPSADTLSNRYEGEIDEFVRQSSKVVAAKVNTVHAIHPGEITIRGSKALAVSFCTMTNRFPLDGHEYDKISSVRLVSKLEKLQLDGRAAWKLLTLECIYIRDGIVSAVPQPPDTVPVFHGAEKWPRGYRYAAWLLSSIGLAARTDLPTEDDRESVREVFDRNRAWLTGV